jgi:ABC-2 type transport system permease protein
MLKKLKENINHTCWYLVEELKSIFGDSGALLILVIAMVMYPLLYSLGYLKETIRDIPVAVVDLDHSQLSRQYCRMADATEQMNVAYKPGSLKEAEELFYKGDVKGVILIPSGFEKSVYKSEQTNITVYSDASYFMLYKQVYAAVSYSAGTLGGGIEIKRMLSEGKSLSQAYEQQEPLKTEVHFLYNPTGGYGTFVLPGIILIIMQQTMLIGIAMIAGTVRKRNRFHPIKNQVAKPMGTVPVLLGKSSAYVLVYLLNSLFAVFMLHKWLALPDKTDFFSVILLLVPFFYSVAFLGLAISTFFRDRAHSLMFLVFLSPVVLFMSGLSWPTAAIPKLLYYAAHVFPSTSMVPAYIRLRICGAPFHAIKAEFFFLLIQMVVYFILAAISYKIMIKRISSRRTIPEHLY